MLPNICRLGFKNDFNGPQDATFGIQEAALLDTQTTVDEEEARDKLSPLPGEMVPDVSEEGNGDDLPSDSDMPDFR